MPRKTNHHFTARKATAKDAEAIVHLQRRAVEKAWGPYVPNFDTFLQTRFDHDSQVAKYAARADDPSRIIMVVETNGQLAGFAAAKAQSPEDQPQGYDYQGGSFYVDPAFEGTGASLVLARAFLEELKSRGAKNICGWCLADNRQARNFYEKRGGTLIADAVTPDEYAQVAPHVAYGMDLPE